MTSSQVRRATQGPLPGGGWPFVSVIMPICNEGRFIGKSLGAVLAQDYPVDRMEVIVVDGMSSDDTRQNVRAIAGDGQRVRLLDNPGKIVPTAMNLGIRAAKGSVIVRVDGHTIIEPEYVSQSVLALARTEAHCVGGMQSAVPGRNYVSRAVAAATSSPFGVGGSVQHYLGEERSADLVYLGVYPKWVLEHIGLYDEEFVRNQDDELDYRLLSAGGSIRLIPSIRSSYSPRPTLWKLAKQYAQYGWWKVRCYQKHPRHVGKRHLVPGAFAFAFICGAALGPASSAIAWLWAAMVVAYGLSGIVFAIALAPKRGWSLVPILPLTFFVMHLSYGTGFLAGLIRFAGRWRQSRTRPTPLPSDMSGWEPIVAAEAGRQESRAGDKPA